MINEIVTEGGTPLVVECYSIKVNPEEAEALRAYPEDKIYIERKPQSEGGEKWAVYAGLGTHRRVLNQQSNWEIEPMPSNRDEDFQYRCRFCLVEDATGAYERWRRRVPNGRPGQNRRRGN